MMLLKLVLVLLNRYLTSVRLSRYGIYELRGIVTNTILLALLINITKPRNVRDYLKVDQDVNSAVKFRGDVVVIVIIIASAALRALAIRIIALIKLVVRKLIGSVRL
jgi:hypothetical protein